MYEQLTFTAVNDGLRVPSRPRARVLPGAAGLMVQGCEQAAFATEHQIWDPSSPVPRSLQEGDIAAIRAQLNGDHIEGNRRSLGSRIATGAVPRWPTSLLNMSQD